MAQGLAVECSSLPIGGNDNLDGLFRRQEQLNREIKYSLQELCGQLRADSRTQSGIGRGCAKTGAYSPSRQMLGAQDRAQKMIAMGRGGAIKKNLVSTNPGVTVNRPEYKCYQCGEGHKKKDCPYWPKDPKVCWKCHSVGHMHRDCKYVMEKATQTPR